MKFSGTIKNLLALSVCASVMPFAFGQKTEVQKIPLPEGAQPLFKPAESPSEAFLKKLSAFALTVSVEPVSSQQPEVNLVLPDALSIAQPITVEGSGFIVPVGKNRDRLMVVAPAHLLKSAGKISIRLSDSKPVVCTLYAKDEVSNLALLQPETQKLPSLGWGDSSRLSPSGWAAVFSPGAPIQGVLEGVPRAGALATRYVPLMQFMSATAGAVGSPVVNDRGEVVGVLSSIRPAPAKNANGSERVNANVGFAIPGNHVQRLIDDLYTFKAVRYPWIGMSFADNPGGGGARVTTVTPKGPCANAGIQAGDVILYLNDQPINNGIDLARAISEQAIDSVVIVKYRRNQYNFSQSVAIKSQISVDKSALTR